MQCLVVIIGLLSDQQMVANWKWSKSWLLFYDHNNYHNHNEDYVDHNEQQLAIKII